MRWRCSTASIRSTGPSLVKALAKAMDKAGRRVPCFVQVNIGEEEQKGGCAIAELPALLAQAREAGIPVIGLMCVPPARDRARAVLRAARQARATTTASPGSAWA